jgi:site-specific DNA recombinase
MNRTYALYVRVSTEEQAKEGFSIETQVEKLTTYAKFQGWVNTEIFADEGHSAKDMHRPQMERLINLIKEKKIAAVCTMAVDRLSRNLLDMMQFIDLCDKHGTAYICATLNFDTSTPIGRMILQILAAFAEFERAMISDRVRTVMSEIAEQNGSYLRKPPFGYAVNEQKHLIIDEEEARWYRFMVEQFLSGLGYYKIAKMLNEKGVKTKTGGTWQVATVRSVLRNPIYTGRLTWGGVVKEGNHPSLVTIEEWERMQERVESMPKGGAVTSKFKLSGLIYCGHCGSKMVSTREKLGPCTNRYTRSIYICKEYHQKGTCRRNIIDREKLESEILAILQSHSEHPPAANINIQSYQKEKEEVWAKKEQSLDAKMQKQIIAYENGLIKDRDLKLANERIEKERRQLEEEKKKAVMPDINKLKEVYKKQIDDLIWGWDNLPPDAFKTKLGRRLIQQITVTNGVPVLSMKLI